MSNIIEHCTWHGYGHYKVAVLYRGKLLYGISKDSLAWDRIKAASEISDNCKSHYGLTLKQALISFRKDVLRCNGLKV